MRRPLPPRVVILVENLPVPLDRRVWLEATTLRNAGWAVVVIGPRGGPGMRRIRDTIDGIDVLRYPQREASGLAGYLIEYAPSMAFSLAWLLWARLRGPIQVIHGCNPPDLFWIIGLIGRLWGARYVYDEHDPSPELSLTKFGSQGLRGKLLHVLTLALESASFRVAHLVLTVNDTCRDIVILRGHLDPGRVVVLRNAPDVNALKELALGQQPTGRRVGYVGVMGTHDGLDMLAEAWALVKREPDMDDAVLEVVGDGPARGPMEHRLAQLGVTSSVRFHGFQPPAVYAPLIARCAIGVSPDPPTPFNNLASMVKIIDYLALGRGCVSFDLAESRLLGGPALLVADSSDPRGLADCVLRVLRDPEMARELGRLADSRLMDLELNWEPYGLALTAAYARLLIGERPVA